MKKTVKVLFSLVLVCLFAVQFAGAMPASASADRVDSKWDNVQLDTSVYVYGDDGAVKQDGDFGVKAGFSGADASGKSTLGEFLNGDYTITPPEGYYVSGLYVRAASKADAESTNLVGYATASKDSAKLTIARGTLANSDNELNTSMFAADDESSSYVAMIYLKAIDTETKPTVKYNDGWLNGKVGGTVDGAVDFHDDVYTHTVVNDYAAYNGAAYNGVETYVGMTLKYANGATMAVEAGDTITLYADATITAKYVVKASVTADDKIMTYGEEVPELTYTPDVPDGYTLTTPTLSLGDYNAETGTRAIILSNAWVADGNGTALDAAQLELTVNNGTLTVAKRDITISAKPVSSEYTGSAVNATENEITSGSLATGDSIKSVEYTGGPVNVGTGTSTPSAAVIVDANGNDVTANYNITYSGAEVTVSKYSGEVVITAKDATKPYDGSALTASNDMTVSGLLGTDTVEAKVSGEATVPGKDGTAKVDSYVIKNAAGEDVSGNYGNVKLTDGKLSVTKRDITVTTGSASKAYDKTALTTKADDYSITSGSLVSGQKLTLALSGTQTEPGSSKNTVKEGSLKISDEQGRDYTAYYNVTIKEGTLEVTGVKVIEISIKATSAKKVYDGTELTANSYDVISGELESGDTLVVEYSGSITNAGTTANKIVKVTAKDANGKDVTAKYKISTQDGTLEITKAPLTVTAKSAEKVYDGKALTANTCEVKGSLAKGHKISATVTGSQTQIGSSKNKASNVKIVDANGNDVTSNYEITYVEGTLTVKAANAKPKTGDDANMGLWIGLMAVSAVIIAGGVVFFVKKNKKKNEQ